MSSSSAKSLGPILTQNKKFILDHLKDPFSAAGYIFEHGHLTRGDLHKIEESESQGERCVLFMDTLIAKDDDKLFDTLLQYLSKESESGGDGSSSHFLLHEKLKTAKDKLATTTTTTPSSSEPQPKKAESLLLDTSGADFTLTLKSLEFICNAVILPNSTVRKQWAQVISNMVGLEDLELLHSSTISSSTSSEEGLHLEADDKMLLRFKESLDLDDVTLFHKNFLHCTTWQDIGHKVLSLWKERNGNNATFFSLVGVFQESRLMDVADWLLENKDIVGRQRG